VIDIIPLEVTSLKVLQPQLAASLEKASGQFESFVVGRSADDAISASQQCIGDIVGILKMLQMPGALRLAQEMMNMLEKMADEPAASEFCFDALTQAFVWLPRYFEYVTDRNQDVPSLALPFINRLLAGLNEALILESEMAEFECSEPVSLLSEGSKKDPDLAPLVSRMRLMYQVGLVGLLREENLELKLPLMHQAVARLADSVGDSPVRTQWRLTEAVLEGLLSGDLQLDYTRKRVLSFVERELSVFENDCDNTEITFSPELLIELVYLVNLSASSDPAISEVFSKLGLARFSVTDRVLQIERSVIHGPTAETMLAVAKVLQEELSQSKATLETAAKGYSGKVDLSPLVSMFQRTSDILSVVGLKTPADILAKIKYSVGEWADGTDYSEENLLEVADGLLFIESTLGNLSRLDLNFEGVADEETKLAMVAKNQLNEAEAIVIKEALAGLAESKKEMSNFIKSDYELTHMRKMSDNLASIRGGFQVLNLDRAASILLNFEKFIQAVVKNGIEDEQTQHLAETMADVLIALEYYLSEIELYGVAPASALDVAEQSLAAQKLVSDQLGFA